MCQIGSKNLKKKLKYNKKVNKMRKKPLITKSMLNTILGDDYSCPRKFYYVYVLKLQTKPSWQMLAGKEIHDFIDKFYDKILIENDELDLSEIEIPVYETAASNYHLVSCIENFIQFEMQRFKSLDDKSYFVPVLREYKATSKELQLRGIVDRVDKHLDEEYIAIEVKTGKPKWNQTLKEESIFYKLLIDSLNLLDKPIKYACAYFPKTNNVYFEEIKEYEVENLEKRIEEARRIIIDEDFVKRRSKHRCSYCNFRERCKMENGVE